MDEVLMQQGLDLMLYGMGSVFAFLTVLVIATVLMSALVRGLFPDPEEVSSAAPAGGAAADTRPDPKTLKIIKAALEQHRQR